uniref:Uncharacterized protein n=1 Tax=Zea mays TaxID=4577 RepID=B6SZY4_MAIZE|nr:hypothetical protein [Zea mays]
MSSPRSSSPPTTPRSRSSSRPMPATTAMTTWCSSLGCHWCCPSSPATSSAAPASPTVLHHRHSRTRHRSWIPRY